MDKYKEAQKRLIDMRNVLEKRLGRIDRHLRQSLDPDLDDQAVESENEEVLADLNDQIRLELTEIEKALGRLDRNEYEICAKCKKTIPMERLEALPFTDLCIDCAEKSAQWGSV